MKKLVMFAMVATVALSFSAQAASRKPQVQTVGTFGEVDPTLVYEHSNPPTFNDCNRLGWTRGVHNERGELDEFMAQCLAGKVPFEGSGGSPR